MHVEDIVTTAKSAITVKRIFGEPYQRDGITVIPAAAVTGGFGGGAGTAKKGKDGEGGGFGMSGRPVAPTSSKTARSAGNPSSTPLASSQWPPSRSPTSSPGVRARAPDTDGVTPPARQEGITMKLHLRPSATATATVTQRRDNRLAAGHGSPNVLAAALESAVRAPSGHNTQPWRFRLIGDRLEVCADRSRALPVVDPDDRALIISCGAAVEFLVVALRGAGFAADVALLPDPSNPDLLASVGHGHRHTPTDRDDQLFSAIDGRHTHRGSFESGAIPADVLTAMQADADRAGASLCVVRDDQAKAHVAELVAEGDRQQMADPRFRAELASWVRSNYTRRRDGIPGYAFGVPGLPSLVGPLFIRLIDMGDRQAAKDVELATAAPALLLLTTPGDTPADWLAAGQAVGTLLLTATAAGLAASFVNQPVETATLRARLGELLAPTGDRPQLLLRLGYPQAPDRPTPRRPVDQVLDPLDVGTQPGSTAWRPRGPHHAPATRATSAAKPLPPRPHP